MALFQILLELFNMKSDVRKFKPKTPASDGHYSIQLDLSDYVHGYGNDQKIFQAIEKASPDVTWNYDGIRHNIMVLTTMQKFKPFKIDLGLVHLVRVK